MKICFVNPTILLRRPIVDLALQLREQGHEVGILTPTFSKSFAKRESDRLLAESNIPVHTIPSYEISRVLWSFPTRPFFISEIRRVLANYDIAHIWAPYYFLSAAPLWLKKRGQLSTKTVLTFDTFPGYSFSLQPRLLNSAMRWYSRRARHLFSAADRITLYSSLLRPYAEQLYIPNEKITVVPTGVFIPEHRQAPDTRTALRRKLGISGEEVAVLFVGLLNDRKGIDTLIEAAQQSNGPLQFVVVGDGPLRGQIQAQVAKLGLAGKVRLTGARQHMADYYNAADIFFLPSRGEGLPGVVMEAMAHGLPVVASDIPCLPDLVAPGKNGYLCPPGDVHCFVRELERLVVSALERQKLGDESYRKIQEFAWPRVVARYQELYARLLN